jgi:hypothetical protein
MDLEILRVVLQTSAIFKLPTSLIALKTFQISDEEQVDLAHPPLALEHEWKRWKVTFETRDLCLAWINSINHWGKSDQCIPIRTIRDLNDCFLTLRAIEALENPQNLFLYIVSF